MSERVSGTGLCITTPHASIDELVAALWSRFDDGALLVTGDDARDAREGVAFELRLADGSVAIRGTCGAIERRPDGARVTLRELTRDSEQVIVRLRAAKLAATAQAPRPSTAPRAKTVLGMKAMRAPAGVPTSVPNVPSRKTKTITIPARASSPAPDAIVDGGATERMATPPLGASTIGVAPSDEVRAEGSSQTTAVARGSAPETDPIVPPPEPPGKQRSIKGMRIATPCATVEEFVEAFHRCCEEKSFFIATRSARPIGLESAFSVDLRDGRPVLRGFGVVLDAWSDGDNRFKKPGVLVGIHQLTADSKRVFEQLLIARAVAADKPRSTIAVLRPITEPVAKLEPPAPPPVEALPTVDAPPPATAELQATAELPAPSLTPITAILAPAIPMLTPTSGILAPQTIDEPATPPPLEPPPLVEMRAPSPAIEPPPYVPQPAPAIAAPIDSTRDLLALSRPSRRHWYVLAGVFAAGALLGLVIGLAAHRAPAPLPPERVLVPAAIPVPVFSIETEAAAPAPVKHVDAPKPKPVPHVVKPKPTPVHVVKPKPAAKCQGLGCL